MSEGDMAETYLVDGQRGVVPDDAGQTREESPRVRGPRQRRFLVPHLPAVGRHKRPYQNRDPCNRHNRALRHEQPTQVIRMHAKKRDLEQPENEKGNHGIGLDALALGDGVLQRQETRPDGGNHALDRVGAVHVLDREPEDGEDRARDDGHVGAPEAPRCAREHGEGRVVYDADGAVERDDKRDYEEGQGDYGDGFAPGETWRLSACGGRLKWGLGGCTDGDDARSELPCRGATTQSAIDL